MQRFEPLQFLHQLVVFDVTDFGSREYVVPPVMFPNLLAQRVDLRVRTPSRCFARLAYGYYPYVDILVDGAQVQPHVSSAGFVIIELDAGEHDIALRPRLSALRASLLWCSLFIVLGSTACYIRSCKSYI